MKKIIICILTLFLCATTTTFAVVAQRSAITKGCSKIAFSDGQISNVDVVQITATEIQYKPCGKPEEAIVSVPKADVLYIKNAEGDMIYRSPKTAVEAVTAVEKASKSTETSDLLSIVGLVLSACSLLLGPLGSMSGLIVSIIALRRINNEPDRYSGKKNAIWGIVIGILATLLFIFLYSIVLFF